MLSAVQAERAMERSRPAAEPSRTLLIALYRPLAVRLLLKSGVFAHLKRQSDLRLVVATHLPVDDKTRAEFAGPNVVVEQLDMAALKQTQNSSRLRRMLRLVRLITYNETNGVELGFKRFRLEEIRQEEDRSRMRLSGRLYSDAILLAPRILGRSRLLRRAWVALEDRIYGRDTQAALLRKYRPDAILVSSLGYGYDEQIMNEAKRFGAKVITVIQSWDNTTTWGYPGGHVDHVVAWSHEMRREAEELLDVDAEKIFVGGVPHWDNYFDGRPPAPSRGQFLREHRLDPNRRTILFSTTSPKMYRDHVPAIRAIAEALQDGRITTPAQLLIRPHPGYYSFGKPAWDRVIRADLDEMRAVAARSNGLVVVDDIRVRQVESTYDVDAAEQERLKGLLQYSDVLVNFYSTQAIEAAIFDLPIVNISFGRCRSTDLPASVIDGWDHYARVLETGAITNASTPESMIDAVNRYLGDRDLHAEERRRLVEQELPVNRGDAGEAIGRQIAAWVRRPLPRDDAAARSGSSMAGS
jgi:hypothetical protein